MTLEIVIDCNRRCKLCGRPGATDNGLCLKCIMKGLAQKKRFGTKRRKASDRRRP